MSATGYRSGRHFLQIPGPTNIPDRVLRAMDRPLIDHRGPEFACRTRKILQGLQSLLRCSGPVLIFPSSGSGAWEAALVNSLSAGDRILMYETGHFAALWKGVAERLGLQVDLLAGDWREGLELERIAERLAQDRNHRIRAVAVIHNETSTGTTSDIAGLRRVLEETGHPALLMVDTISSLGSLDYRHDEWGVDVTVGASQKGLMLPPGLGLNAVSRRALEAARKSTLPRSYWDWQPILDANSSGFFPYTPATSLLFGLEEALEMLFEEGLERVFARHRKLAEATRRAVQGWGLELFCRRPERFSHSVTAVLLAPDQDPDRLREIVLRQFDLALGAGLGKIRGQVFRIGHLGDFNELMLAGTLCGVQMGLDLAGIPHRKEGIQRALEYLARSDPLPQGKL